MLLQPCGTKCVGAVGQETELLHVHNWYHVDTCGAQLKSKLVFNIIAMWHCEKVVLFSKPCLYMYKYVESEVWGWIVHCVLYVKAKYTCKLLPQYTVHPRTSYSTYAYIYRHGSENKTTSLHCYVATVLNTNLLSGSAP